jgi:hypothetical protein
MCKTWTLCLKLEIQTLTYELTWMDPLMSNENPLKSPPDTKEKEIKLTKKMWFKDRNVKTWEKISRQNLLLKLTPHGHCNTSSF